MENNIFSMNEIITIVMEEINFLEFSEVYGVREEINLPRPIEDKINNLSKDNYEEFTNIILNIAEEIFPIKSGELNELNKCHEEIMILAEKRLKNYIYTK